MKKRLLKALFRLASVSYQDIYIIHGAADEYVLSADLVEDVSSLCELAKKVSMSLCFRSKSMKYLLLCYQK